MGRERRRRERERERERERGRERKGERVGGGQTGHDGMAIEANAAQYRAHSLISNRERRGSPGMAVFSTVAPVDLRVWTLETS